MRRTLVLLCLLANISVLLMPLGMHAHLDGHHRTFEVHGEHQHGRSHEAHEFSATTVMDLQIAAVDRIGRPIDWTAWSPLLAVTVVLLTPLLVYWRVRPHAPDIPTIARRSFWHPPLRGPPHSVFTR